MNFMLVYIIVVCVHKIMQLKKCMMVTGSSGYMHSVPMFLLKSALGRCNFTLLFFKDFAKIFHTCYCC